LSDIVFPLGRGHKPGLPIKVEIQPEPLRFTYPLMMRFKHFDCENKIKLKDPFHNDRFETKQIWKRNKELKNNLRQ